MSEVLAALERLDRRGLEALARIGSRPAVTAPVSALTKAGEHGLVWNGIALAGWAIDRPRARGWWAVGTAARRSYLLNQLIKFSVRRPRPQLADFPQAAWTGSQKSFPSAHATMAFASARILRRLLPATPVYALAGAVLISRPMLAVHYPSDSLAGALLGHLVAGPIERRLER